MKKSIVGILAHVDAGKTTLAESLLCACGVIEKAGRVDHGDAFLDNGDMERKRGITIFSKQARIRWKDVDITLLDTPGHVDFSAEMERTLQVLDAAALVIDGSDGVQGDVHTLWRLLKRYEVPVFLFVNKMDQPGTDPEKVLTELQKKLDSNITSVGKLLQPGDNEGERETELEHAAMCSEALMEEYLETGELSAENISDTVAERKLFPCFFGSALKQWGITELLDGLNAYLPQPEYPEEFGARVYKIGRDNAGIRLSYLKVTGGSLRVKMPVGNSRSGAGEEIWEEKCDQLRLYNGGSYEAVDTVKAGEVCAVTGLTKTFAGQGLGYESENSTPILEPVLTYRLLLPPEVDPVVALGKLRQLEEEEPQLHVLWQEENREIHMQVMGQVQMEILKNILWERFGLEVEFIEGSIVYKETLAEPVEGIGHFEALRHYAEVHLLLEPGERGSGEDLMKEVAVLMQGQLEETGIIHRKHRENMQHTMLKGDALQLQRIMMNLFGNAVKYNKKNGTIDTYVTEISCDGKNVLYEFRIADSGIGMSREYMEHELFQPFTQEKADARTQYKGTGLGMSIVKGLIDKMNGTISVRSTLGEGSEFTFRLTFCLAEEGAQQASDNMEERNDDLAEMRVLLVEDNDINMEIAEFYLAEAGIIVEKAWNGKEAVEKYEGTPKGYYSAILMDIMMPVMNGIEAARNIRRKEKNGGKEIPIIAMTAQSERESKESCSLAGMNAYISKPVDPENLIRILRMYQKR